MNEQLITRGFDLLDKLLFNCTEQSIDDRMHKMDIEYTIDSLVHQISKLDNICKIKNYLTKLVMVPFLKRDINLKYGDGERKVSYWAFIRIHSIFPKTMERMLDYFPYVGYWGDLNAIYKIVFNSSKYQYKERLLNRIIDTWVFNLQIEEAKLNNNITSVNILCKWIPKQKSSLDRDTKVVNRIVKAYFPHLYKKNKFKALKRYRHLVSDINRLIQTTEVYMCNKEFSKINFNNVPAKCLNKNKRAWLDETIKGKRKNLPLLDRTIGRNNYLDYVNSSGNKNIYLNVTDKNSYKNLSLLSKLDNKYFNTYKHLIHQISELDYFIMLAK